MPFFTDPNSDSGELYDIPAFADDGATPQQQNGTTPIDPRTGQPVIGGGVDPWGQGPGDPNYGYPPAGNANPAPAPTSGGGGYSGGGSFTPGPDGRANPANFASPDPLKPWTEQFNAPTMQDAINSPGFQFRLDEGLKALQRSAAAKGTLLTGGTLKGLNDYAQNQATTQYQTDYNNAYNEYDSRRQNFLTNEANRYQSQRGNLNDQWQISNDYFNQGLAQKQSDFNIFNGNRLFDYGVFNDNRNFTRGLNQDSWSNALNLASLGKPPAPTF